MRLHSLASRAAPWLAVCALVLRAGMPLLAVAAAQRGGVPVGAVCEVYGVVLPSTQAPRTPGHAHHDHAGQPHHHSGSEAGHDGSHCALTALGALGTPSGTPRPTEVHHAACASRDVITVGRALHDACAAWAARLGHGPPTRA